MLEQTGIRSSASIASTSSSLLAPLSQALAIWIPALELKLASSGDDTQQLLGLVKRGGEESENYRARAEGEILLQSLQRVEGVLQDSAMSS